MVLTISKANPTDVHRIAAIHLSAFNSNLLLHAQFPTPASLKALELILSNDMLRDIEKGEASGRVVLVVRDSDAEDEIISFAKWDLPRLEKDAEVHPGVAWPVDCRREFLDEYHEKAEGAKSRVVGDRVCYRLTFVGTEPRYERRGAGTLLTQWGLSRAKDDSIPVYLESTISASSLYSHLGFVTLDGLSMKLPGLAPDGGPNIYEEVGMLRTWDEKEGHDDLESHPPVKG